MSAGALKWTTDGQTLCTIVWTWSDAADDDAHRKKEKALKDNKVKAFVIDSAQFRYWDQWIADGRQPTIFAVDLASGKHRDLLAGQPLRLNPFQPSADDFDVSPDGKELCFVADSAKDFGMEFNSDLYTLSTEFAFGQKRQAKNLTAENLAHDSAPVYSPDGKSLAFLRQTTKHFYADRVRLMSLDRATGAKKELTANLDRSCTHQLWTKDGQRLYFEVEDKGYVRLAMVSAQGVEVTFLTGQCTDRVPSLSADGKTMAFVRSTFVSPPSVHVLSLGQGEPRKVGRFNDELVAEWQLGEVKEEWFKGADERDVQYWLVLPPGFDAKKQWPLLQVVHGGPHNAITSDFHFRWNLQLFAAWGYVVTCVNFHGSSGFGQQFTDSITGDIGTKPMLDILKATDIMEARPYIDKTRTTAAGASYGGYMMAWLNGHTDRYKAMVCHAGVYNWHSMMASDILKTRERSLGVPPWTNMKKVDTQSPQRFAAHFKTPTLVMHGEKDYRVPITQGFEYYNTLRQKGVACRLVYFPDENHWIAKPQNARLWHQEFRGWLNRHVGHGPSKK
jgi:dipeptidyl aminopeptidase/acylaminoacyl peptidase